MYPVYIPPSYLPILALDSGTVTSEESSGRPPEEGAYEAQMSRQRHCEVMFLPPSIVVRDVSSKYLVVQGHGVSSVTRGTVDNPRLAPHPPASFSSPLPSIHGPDPLHCACAAAAAAVTR